jgi:hypothetical protein
MLALAVVHEAMVVQPVGALRGGVNFGSLSRGGKADAAFGMVRVSSDLIKTLVEAGDMLNSHMLNRCVNDDNLGESWVTGTSWVSAHCW